jgi:hypothetical protein
LGGSGDPSREFWAIFESVSGSAKSGLWRIEEFDSGEVRIRKTRRESVPGMVPFFEAGSELGGVNRVLV